MSTLFIAVVSVMVVGGILWYVRSRRPPGSIGRARHSEGASHDVAKAMEAAAKSPVGEVAPSVALLRRHEVAYSGQLWFDEALAKVLATVADGEVHSFATVVRAPTDAPALYVLTHPGSLVERAPGIQPGYMDECGEMMTALLSKMPPGVRCRTLLRVDWFIKAEAGSPPRAEVALAYLPTSLAGGPPPPTGFTVEWLSA